MKKIFLFKTPILLFFIVLGIASSFFIPNLKFSFDFSQFFPEGDQDLIFYNSFIKEFGTDDNFLLVSVENPKTVFQKDFLSKFNQFTLEAKKLPNVKQSQSLTTLFYPLKTSFGYTRLPVIHIDQPTRYASDWEKIQSDGLFTRSFIDKKGTSLVLALETKDNLNYKESTQLMHGIRLLLNQYSFQESHFVGRAFFYESLVQLQKKELLFAFFLAALLVMLILYFIYRKIVVVFLSFGSLAMSLLLFLGLMSILGKELNALATFFPILIIMVGVSDFIHIMDHYILEIGKSNNRLTALQETIKNSGTSTLLTSLTTAAGFASLLTSKLGSIRDFGMNAALAVLLTYLTIIFFTCSLLLLVPKKYLLRQNRTSKLWHKNLMKVNDFTKRYPRAIITATLLMVLVCFVGISKIHTDYKFQDSMPQGSKLALDFSFFQKNYAGFRPLEIAILSKKAHKVTDFKLVQQVEKLQQKLKALKSVNNIYSANTLYKAIHKAHNLNKTDSFVLPKTEKVFDSYKKDVQKFARKQFYKFVNKTETKGRLTATLLDVGSDSLKNIYANLRTFINTKTDTSIVSFKLTGRSILLDKNSVYIRNSLLYGLAIAFVLVGLLMTLLFKDLKLLIISFIPNILPLLVAAAILGFGDIPLEASISVVFAIVFGIAVDDTIHFLSKYKICISNGLDKETALKSTFNKTGKAIVLTTIILFFGFSVMLFSAYKPSETIGLLIGATLLTALAFDLLLLPVLIRKLL